MGNYFLIIKNTSIPISLSYATLGIMEEWNQLLN